MAEILRAADDPIIQFRLVHAFRTNNRFKPGQPVFAIVIGPPLYLVQGLFASENDAVAALAAMPHQPPWSTFRPDDRKIYATTAPRQLYDTTLCVTEHWWTDEDYVPPDPGSATKRNTHDIESIQLRITFKGGEYATYTLSPDADAIFLTRGAWEYFAYPQHISFAGAAYADEYRKRLGFDPPIQSR